MDFPEIEFLSWKRPESVARPLVWHRFETKEKNGQRYKIRIQDLTEDRYDEAWDFMVKYYFGDEPLSVSSNLPEDPMSMMVYQYLISKVLEQNVSIVALLDENTEKPTIVGMQILSVATKTDPSLPEVPGDAIQKFAKIYLDIRKDHDPFEVFNTDRFLHEWGLVVAPEYRGMDIGFNILKSLANVAKAYQLPATMIMFTRVESQRLAERNGFSVYNEIVYKDYKDENGEIVFPIEHTKSLKLMGRKYT